MNDSEFQLLLDELSQRIPYNVIVNHTNSNIKALLLSITKSGKVALEGIDGTVFSDTDIYAIKPYLRPMSSMTENELNRCVDASGLRDIPNPNWTNCENDFSERRRHSVNVWKCDFAQMKWLNSHHFDYNGLIERGLALAAPDGMYEKSEFMTKEEKAIMLDDLCKRLPHGVYLQVNEVNCLDRREAITEGFIGGFNKDKVQDYTIEDVREWLDNGDIIKPYLRPLSDMTREEEEELGKINDCKVIYGENFTIPMKLQQLDWLLAHHFDYNGLIKKGIALKATKSKYDNI
jgi:hypothetical protein